MALAEIAYEQFSLALEATRGTLVTPPTAKLNVAGTLTEMHEVYNPPDEMGVLAEFQREEIVRKWGEWAASGAPDVTKLPMILNMALAPVTSPTTPANGVLTRLWTFTRGMTSDAIKAATFYWGDPNAKLYQGAYGLLTEFSIEGDASGTDGVTMSLNGICQTPTALGSNPTLPAIAVGPLLVPGRMQLWIDTSSAFGTTEITGRVISAGLSVPTGVVPKYVATGPTGTVTFDHVGRQRTHPELQLRFELADQTQYANYTAGDYLKVRVRWNGPLIESVTPDYYYYVQADIYGKFSDFSWSDLEGTNRAMDVTIKGVYNSTLASDLKMYVQNTETALPA